MNKIIEFFKSLIAKTGKSAQTDVVSKTVKSEQKSEEVQTSQTSQTP